MESKQWKFYLHSTFTFGGHYSFNVQLYMSLILNNFILWSWKYKFENYRSSNCFIFSTHYYQYLMILHYPWLRVKSKLFSRAKNVKKWKSSYFGTPSSTSDSSGLIWARDFGVGLLDSLWSVLDDFALKSDLANFTLSHGFLKLITCTEIVKSVLVQYNIWNIRIFGAPGSTPGGDRLVWLLTFLYEI